MINLSQIGFGGLTISGLWGETDDQTSIKSLHKAVEEGINWIDTSPIYGLGHSEELIGKAVKDRRDQIYLATKCGLYLGKEKKAKKNLKPQFIVEDLESSLKRLNTSYIDLYQCHWPDPETPVEETWNAMKMLVEQGKVREIGVCNFDIKLLEKIQGIHPVYSLQIPYNIIRREHEKELIPYCVENNIRVLAYSPLHLGLLSGKYDPAHLPENDRRRTAQEWGSPELLKQYFSFMEKMKVIADAKQATLAQVALAWLINNSCVSSLIAGMRTPDQVVSNIQALHIEFSKSDIEYLCFQDQI